MDMKVKQRLLGAIVILALIVIFLPMLFNKHLENKDGRDKIIPPAPSKPKVVVHKYAESLSPGQSNQTTADHVSPMVPAGESEASSKQMSKSVLPEATGVTNSASLNSQSDTLSSLKDTNDDEIGSFPVTKTHTAGVDHSEDVLKERPDQPTMSASPEKTSPKKGNPYALHDEVDHQINMEKKPVFQSKQNRTFLKEPSDGAKAKKIKQKSKTQLHPFPSMIKDSDVSLDDDLEALPLPPPPPEEPFDASEEMNFIKDTDVSSGDGAVGRSTVSDDLKQFHQTARAVRMKPVSKSAQVKKTALHPSSLSNNQKVKKSLMQAKQKNQAWIVQLGSFSSLNNADRLAKKLRSKGFSGFVHKAVSQKGSQLSYRVYVGPFVQHAHAKAMLSKIFREAQLKEGMVVKFDSRKI